MNKTIFTLIVSLFIFLLGAGVSAQNTELPNPGITPDSPFYFFERIFEEIGIFFTFGDLNKAARYAALVSERIAEAEAMTDKGDPEAAQNALVRYEAQLNKALARAESAKNKEELTEEIVARVAEATTKHLAVLDEVLDKVPEEAKKGIERARIASMEGQKNALRALAGDNPEEAIKINLEAAEARLNRAKAKAQESDIEGVEEAVKEFKSQNKFGEEISQIAQGLGKDITTVEQLVGKATSIHLEILAEVYEKVPEQAKESIEKAMEVSVQGHERAVESLREKGQLNDVPKKPPMPKGLPEQVKEKIQKLKIPQQ